jgi:hypothetical protein
MLKTAAAEHTFACEQVRPLPPARESTCIVLRACVWPPSLSVCVCLCVYKAVRFIATVKYGPSLVEAAVICYPSLSDKDNFSQVQRRTHKPTHT